VTTVEDGRLRRVRENVARRLVVYLEMGEGYFEQLLLPLGAYALITWHLAPFDGEVCFKD
jgi:hypothetical protein